MRVGIITQPLYTNYGGILQNYALQQVLKKMGHTPITLDYLPTLTPSRYALSIGKGLFCSFPPHWPNRFWKRRPEIESFIQSNISVSKTFSHYSKDILKEYGIDAVIVGSDQVWRYSYNWHYIEDMFLAFAADYPCKKIAYAASFGIDEWDYPQNKYLAVKGLVDHFTAISVREDSGVRLCKDYLAVNAAVVLDPTLLLDASVYERFCKAPEPSSKPYLAAYILDINAEKKQYIEAIAQTKDLEIKDMTVADKGISIEEWLTIIRNAEFVITDSYHGSLFSIIFDKQFQTIVNRERGANRFLTVFNKLGISDRLIYSLPDKPKDTGQFDPRYVKKKLDSLINDSSNFLHSSLN